MNGDPTTTSALQETCGDPEIPYSPDGYGQVLHSRESCGLGHTWEFHVKQRTSNCDNQELSDSETATEAFSGWNGLSPDHDVEIAQPKFVDGPAEVVLQGLKKIKLTVSGGGTVVRWMVMDRDGTPLLSESGNIVTVWKEFPPTNSSHVLEDKSKDHE